jgi:FkbM family methyltransferase
MADEGDGGGNRIMKALRALGIPGKEARTASEMLTILLAQRKAQRRVGADPMTPDLLNFFAFAMARAGRAQGQLFQDLWVLFELGEPSGGYFVEFGATNGVTMSNSHLLEKHYGWQGILAEPNPEYHDRLGRERDCHISHKCVYARSGERMQFLCTDQAVFSRLAEVNPGDLHEAEKRANPRAIEVETVALEDLLQEFGAPDTIDYLSVDTEGSEHDILAAFDFSRRFVRCLTVEHNFTPLRDALHDLLTAQGYIRRFPEFTRFDDWYIHRDAARG